METAVDLDVALGEQDVRPWFGEPWPSERLRASPCEDDAARVAAPVGERCLLCRELVVEGDRGTFMGVGRTAGDPADRKIEWTVEPTHAECQLRNIVGNLLHVTGQCRHTGDCNERSTLSYREEALQVWAYYYSNGSTDVDGRS